MTAICDLCRRPRRIRWHLSCYHGISGSICGPCYERISHDPSGTPRHPRRYAAALKRFSPLSQE